MFYSLYSGLHALYGMKKEKFYHTDGAVIDFHLYILKWTHIIPLNQVSLPGTVDILQDRICCEKLSCALYNVQQHSWPSIH